MRFYFFLWMLLGEFFLLRGELWEKDLTSVMKIGLSNSGYHSVDLRCDPEHFSVNVTLEREFQGVIYTRGNFNEKKMACFKGPNQANFNKGKMLFIHMKIPFDECGTLMDISESRYSNTLVIQNDPDLIMPGDAAFTLDCAFVPQFIAKSEIKIKEPPFRSKITLVDADPSAPKENSHTPQVAFSNTEKVTFFPDSSHSKDEL